MVDRDTGKGKCQNQGRFGGGQAKKMEVKMEAWSPRTPRVRVELGYWIDKAKGSCMLGVSDH